MAVSPCIDGLRLSIPDSLLDFSGANNVCSLAIPTTFEKFTRMQELVESLGERVWVGLVLSEANEALTSNPLDFVNSGNGLVNPFSSGNPGAFPWGDNEPGSSEIEECVELKGDNLLLNNKDCETEQLYMCEEFCEEVPNVVFEGGECIEGVEFFFNPDVQTFEGGLVDCSRVDPTGTMAIPKNSDQLTRIFDIIINNTGSTSFVGLVDFEKRGGGEPERFLSMENEILPFIDVERGEFPWRDGRPNDQFRNQDCTQMIPRGEKWLDDTNCDRNLTSVCQRICGDINLNAAVQNQTKANLLTGIILILLLLIGNILILFKLQKQVKDIDNTLYTFFGL